MKIERFEDFHIIVGEDANNDMNLGFMQARTPAWA
jgi:hypothetical protein